MRAAAHPLQVAAPLTVGLGAACDIARREMAYDSEHIRRLSNRLIEGVTSQLTDIVLNGDPVNGCARPRALGGAGRGV